MLENRNLTAPDFQLFREETAMLLLQIQENLCDESAKRKD